jgi:myo-inositol-1(or 4)-monophosphatase
VSEEAAELNALAVELAEEAGQILLATGKGRVESKSSPTDLVTEADRAAERHIYTKLVRLRPEDTIIAEEGSSQQGTSGIAWVVDPLDGTVNFVYGLPQWCVSIGVEGRVRLGVVHDPNRNETFSSMNPTFRVNGKTELSNSLIGTGFSYSAEIRTRQAKLLNRVLPQVRDIRRGGSAALDLAYVACGRLDGFYEEDNRHWDISAGIALIESAGGFVRLHGSLTIAACTQQLLTKLEALVLP